VSPGVKALDLCFDGMRLELHVGCEALSAVVINVAVVCESTFRRNAFWFLAGPNFDGGDESFRNVGSNADYATLYRRRW
jgi:hypothetical protein